jgi:NADPH:quinone reductase-like Zn-dependent oxidoreductase
MGGISWEKSKEIGCTMKENMHRAWRCHVFGDYHDLKLESVPQPLPGPGQVLVRVRALAPGFPDMLMVQGRIN